MSRLKRSVSGHVNGSPGGLDYLDYTIGLIEGLEP